MDVARRTGIKAKLSREECRGGSESSWSRLKDVDDNACWEDFLEAEDGAQRETLAALTATGLVSEAKMSLRWRSKPTWSRP